MASRFPCCAGSQIGPGPIETSVRGRLRSRGLHRFHGACMRHRPGLTCRLAGNLLGSLASGNTLARGSVVPACGRRRWRSRSRPLCTPPLWPGLPRVTRLLCVHRHTPKSPISKFSHLPAPSRSRSRSSTIEPRASSIERPDPHGRPGRWWPRRPHAVTPARPAERAARDRRSRVLGPPARA